jgi:hypothetical protein
MQTIPGVGAATLAAVFVTEIGDISRFSRAGLLGGAPKHREPDTSGHDHDASPWSRTTHPKFVSWLEATDIRSPLSESPLAALASSVPYLHRQSHTTLGPANLNNPEDTPFTRASSL